MLKLLKPPCLIVGQWVWSRPPNRRVGRVPTDSNVGSRAAAHRLQVSHELHKGGSRVRWEFAKHCRGAANLVGERCKIRRQRQARRCARMQRHAHGVGAGGNSAQHRRQRSERHRDPHDESRDRAGSQEIRASQMQVAVVQVATTLQSWQSVKVEVAGRHGGWA